MAHPTVEYRVVRTTKNRWAAEFRDTRADEELHAAWILPGWHAFKISVNRAVCEKAIAQLVASEGSLTC